MLGRQNKWNSLLLRLVEGTACGAELSRTIDYTYGGEACVRTHLAITSRDRSSGMCHLRRLVTEVGFLNDWVAKKQKPCKVWRAASSGIQRCIVRWEAKLFSEEYVRVFRYLRYSPRSLLEIFTTENIIKTFILGFCILLLVLYQGYWKNRPRPRPLRRTVLPTTLIIKTAYWNESSYTLVVDW
jgi:hypothetical protein